MSSVIELMSLKAASEAFAIEPLPDNWEALSEQEQEGWLTEHKWAVLENDSNDEFYSRIDAHANTIRGVVDDVLTLLEEKLVQAAIDCKLPSDFNELDLQAMLEKSELDA